MIDTLLVISVLVSLLNLGDWILRPSQKKVVDGALETLTLKLEYTRPIGWFGRLAEPKVARRWTVFCGLFFFLFFVLSASPGAKGGALALLYDLWTRTTVLQLRVAAPLVNAGHPEVVFGIVFAGLAASSIIAILVLGRIGPRLTARLATPAKFWPYFGKMLLLYGLSALFMFVSSLGAEHAGDQWWYLPIGLPIWLLQLVPVVLCTVALLMFTLVPVFGVLELLLKLARGIAWRIVEYSKGPWAAVILLATVSLGVYKAVVT